MESERKLKLRIGREGSTKRNAPTQIGTRRTGKMLGGNRISLKITTNLTPPNLTRSRMWSDNDSAFGAKVVTVGACNQRHGKANREMPAQLVPDPTGSSRQVEVAQTLDLFRSLAATRTSPTSNTMKTTYVYLIQEDKQSHKAPVKIGLAVNVEERLMNLQVGNPRKLVIRAKIGPMSALHARDMEKRLHRRFKQLRISGEWFSGKVLARINKEMSE